MSYPGWNLLDDYINSTRRPDRSLNPASGNDLRTDLVNRRNPAGIDDPPNLLTPYLMAANTGTNTVPGNYDDINKQIERARAVQISDDQMQIIRDAAGGDEKTAQTMANLLKVENRGSGYINNQALSPKGASGPWQFMPKTWEWLGGGDADMRQDFPTAARAAAKFVKWIGKNQGTTDDGVIGAYWNGGGRAAKAVSAGQPAPARETQDYVTIIRGLGR